MPQYSDIRALNGLLGCKKLRVVVKNDSTDLMLQGAYPCGIWVATAGDVAIVAEDDTLAVTIQGVPNGTWLDIHPKKIMSTGTTAAAMVVGYNRP